MNLGFNHIFNPHFLTINVMCMGKLHLPHTFEIMGFLLCLHTCIIEFIAQSHSAAIVSLCHTCVSHCIDGMLAFIVTKP